MGLGSYLRFFVGLLLSIEIIRQLILGKTISTYATVLAIVFIVLAVWFFIEKFVLKY